MKDGRGHAGKVRDSLLTEAGLERQKAALSCAPAISLKRAAVPALQK